MVFVSLSPPPCQRREAKSTQILAAGRWLLFLRTSCLAAALLSSLRALLKFVRSLCHILLRAPRKRGDFFSFVVDIIFPSHTHAHTHTLTCLFLVSTIAGARAALLRRPPSLLPLPLLLFPPPPLPSPPPPLARRLLLPHPAITGISSSPFSRSTPLPRTLTSLHLATFLLSPS